jgi:uncharacterized protein YjgD (DUF1641 family)
MSVVNQLLTESSQNLFESQMNKAMTLAQKWKKSGLLEGLSDDTEKANMSVLLENQAKRLIVENNTTNQGGATFTAGTGEQYAAVALPLVRKVFGQIAAKEFVSVQPMSLPAGLIFFLDFQFGNTKSPFAKGDSLYGKNSLGNVFSNDAEGGLYGAGRFGYSTNQFSVPSASAGFGAITSASIADVNYDSNYSASIAAGSLKKITVQTASLADFDKEGVRAFMVSGSGVNPQLILQQFTEKGNGTIEFIYSGTPTLTDAVVLYNKQTRDNARGDFEDSTAGNFSIPNAASSDSISIPEFNIQMKSDTIAAKTKKLKASWTPEFSQDLNAFQSIDAEAEVTGLMSEYISLEIDMEILDMLVQNAPTTEYWSAKVGLEWNGNGFSNDNSAGLYYTKMSWFQTIGTKLQKVSNMIHQKTLRGGANFMVVSPSVATVLESIPGFAADTDGAAEKATYAFGVQKVGALNSRYKVYKNPYMIENTILMGFRGNQFLETGAVYAPYIPVMTTPLVYDPETFTPRKGIMTRYAKKMVRPEFYARVVVANLDAV